MQKNYRFQIALAVFAAFVSLLLQKSVVSADGISGQLFPSQLQFQLQFQQGAVDPLVVAQEHNQRAWQAGSSKRKNKLDPFDVIHRQLFVRRASPAEADEDPFATDTETGHSIGARRKPSWVGTKEKRPKQKLSARGAVVVVVQTRNDWSDADYRSLITLGIEPLRLLAVNAVLARGAPKHLQVLAQSSPRLRAISKYQPQWKLSRDLRVSSVFTGEIDERVDIFPFHPDEIEVLKRELNLLAKKEKGLREIQVANRWVERNGRIVPIVQATIRSSLLPTVAEALQHAEFIDVSPATLWIGEARVRGEYGMGSRETDVPRSLQMDFESRRSDFTLADEKGPLPGEDHIYSVEIKDSGEYTAELEFLTPEIGLSLAESDAQRLKERLQGSLLLGLESAQIAREVFETTNEGKAVYRVTARLSAGANRIRVAGVFLPLGPIPYSLNLTAQKP